MIPSIDVSIIIVNWNTRDILRDCLASVYAQTQDITFEVIVIDNSSSDGSTQMVKSEFPQVILVENTENRGFAAANNQGMRIAKGRYILLLNSDTVILDGAIQKTVHYADRHPEAGVIGSRAQWPDGHRMNTCFRFHSLILVAISSILFFRMAKIFHRSFLHPDRYPNLDFDREQDVDVVAGCFFLVRQKVIDQVGMLDEDFFIYGEEAEWCYRIVKAGWRVRYFPDAHFIHLHGASSSQVEDTHINKRKGTLLCLDKTKGLIYAWTANVLMTIGIVLRIPFWILTDIKDILSRKKPAVAWNSRFNVIAFHLKALFWPVWR